MLYRSKSINLTQNKQSPITELIIAKQRNGPVGSVKLAFNESQTRFLEMDD